MAILKSEEEHIDYLQTQFRLIEQMGIENFVQLQTKPNASGLDSKRLHGHSNLVATEVALTDSCEHVTVLSLFANAS